MTLHLLEQIFSLYIKESVVAFEMNLIHCTNGSLKIIQYDVLLSKN